MPRSICVKTNMVPKATSFTTKLTHVMEVLCPQTRDSATEAHENSFPFPFLESDKLHFICLIHSDKPWTEEQTGAEDSTDNIATRHVPSHHLYADWSSKKTTSIFTKD